MRYRNIVTLSGAIVAYLIGSGFATGQEALQYFSAYGYPQLVGGLLLTLAIYLWFGVSVVTAGYRLQLENANTIYGYYCGKYLALFYELYTPAFLYVVFVVMVAGCGAVLHQNYGVSREIGRALMAGIVCVSVLFSLHFLLEILAKLGPLLIIVMLIVSLNSLLQHSDHLADAAAKVASLPLTKASQTWYWSGVIFPAMGCLFMMTFLIELGAKASTEKEAQLGVIGGLLLFMVALTILSFAILANIDMLYLKAVPTLFMAQQVSPLLDSVFVVVLVLGIYTTAAPMLWLSCHALIGDTRSIKFKVLVIIMAVLGYVFSHFPFAKLINVLYPVSGYLGAVLMACMLLKQGRNFLVKKMSRESK